MAGMWTCKGRVRQWLQDQHIIPNVDDIRMKGYLSPQFNRIHLAITKLVLEGWHRGYEQGYREGKQAGRWSANSGSQPTHESVGATAYNSHNNQRA